MITLKFKNKHKTTSIAFKMFLYLTPSVHRYPFLSIRWLCFEFIHDWNPYDVVINGAVKVRP